MPTVSVILPTYNSAGIIQPTLDSIFAQTYQDFELLIVDDGSKDDTVAFANQLSDPRVRVHAFPNAGAGGPAVSRNRGIELAEGRYIAFINHDDLWTADKLDMQVNALEENPTAGVAYSWIDHIDDEGEPLYPGGYTRATGDVFPEMIRGHICQTGSNPLIRRQVFDAVGNFDLDYRLFSDWEFFIRAARQFEFINVPKVHVLFKVLPDALSANTQKLERDGLKVINDVYSDVSEALIDTRHNATAELYEYLASRSLQGVVTSAMRADAVGYLRKAVRCDASIVVRKPWRLTCIVAKLVAYTILPVERVNSGIARYRRHRASFV